MSVLLVLVIVMLSPSGTLALPDHVPVERHPDICTSMEPESHHHQPTTATGPPPYNIEVSSPTYKTGESIQGRKRQSSDDDWSKLVETKGSGHYW